MLTTPLHRWLCCFGIAAICMAVASGSALPPAFDSSALAGYIDELAGGARSQCFSDKDRLDGQFDDAVRSIAQSIRQWDDAPTVRALAKSLFDRLWDDLIVTSQRNSAWIGQRIAEIADEAEAASAALPVPRCNKKAGRRLTAGLLAAVRGIFAEKMRAVAAMQVDSRRQFDGDVRMVLGSDGRAQCEWSRDVFADRFEHQYAALLYDTLDAYWQMQLSVLAESKARVRQLVASATSGDFGWIGF